MGREGVGRDEGRDPGMEREGVEIAAGEGRHRKTLRKACPHHAGHPVPGPTGTGHSRPATVP